MSACPQFNQEYTRAFHQHEWGEPLSDPSGSMRNFNHTMKLTKTGGFQAMEQTGLAAPLPSG